MPDFFVLHLDATSNKYHHIEGPNPNKSFTGLDGTDANGLAAIASGFSGKFVALAITPGHVKAWYQTAGTVSNADLLYTAQLPGSAGNNIRIKHVQAGISTSLSVSVSTNDITVNLATNGSGVATSTAAQVLAAVQASTPASALVTVAHAAGSTGAGVFDPLVNPTFRNLTHGSDGDATADIVSLSTSPVLTPTTV